MLRCFIIDDEAMAIKVIENHLRSVQGIEVAATFTDAIEAFSAIQEQEVDLLFLDIQMPGLTGLSLLAALQSQPLVVLTTAYKEFALESYDFRVVDYLLKPISFERFLKAMSKVFHLVNLPSATLGNEYKRKIENQPFIYIKSERQFVKILLDEILFIESIRNHVRIITDRGNHLTLTAISEMEIKLPPQRFLRIHKSYIISLLKVESFSAGNVTVRGQTLPIGQMYQAKAAEILGQYVL